MEMISTRKLYSNPFTICIEGNIGSGKTTFLNHFQSLNNATILQEPVDLWRNVAGVNLLVSYFKDDVWDVSLRFWNIVVKDIQRNNCTDLNRQYNYLDEYLLTWGQRYRKPTLIILSGSFLQGLSKLCLSVSIVCSIDQITVTYYEYTIALQGYGKIHI